MKSKCVVEYKNDSGYVGVTLERKNNMSLVLWTVLEEPEFCKLIPKPFTGLFPDIQIVFKLDRISVLCILINNFISSLFLG